MNQVYISIKFKMRKEKSSSYYDSEEDDSFATRQKNDPPQTRVVPGLKLGNMLGGGGAPNQNDYVSRTARGPPERMAPLGVRDLPVLGEDGSEDIIQRQITILKHKQLQLKFMGDENKNLEEESRHLKEVIKGFKSLFTDDKSMQLFNQQEKRIVQINKENQEMIAKSLLDHQVVQAANQKLADYQESAETQINTMTAQLDRKEY